jgi:ATP-grasp domain, R2K clade family 3
MRVIFCSDVFNPRQPDDAYLQEAQAVASVGGSYDVISYEALVNEGNPVKAVRMVSAAVDRLTAIYRGWMFTPEQYEQIYEALLTKNIELINDPAAYKHCHYLPESYHLIAKYSPRTLWLPNSPGLGLDMIAELLKPFGSSPVIVKDYVKSRKHEWLDACYIPSASDKDAVARVVSKFIERQGDDLQGGLVFREFVELEPLGIHSKSDMPLTREYRIFVFDKEPLHWVPYWEEGDYGEEIPPLEQFREIAEQVKSRFFTMDIAKQVDGKWIIIELGDGQVAGLPERSDPVRFYEALAGRLR